MNSTEKRPGQHAGSLLEDIYNANVRWTDSATFGKEIRDAVALPWPSIPTQKQASSNGTLDVLSLETLWHALRYLDFQSLCRLRQVSHAMNYTVQSLLAYRDVMQNASSILVALAGKSMLKYHSAALLSKAMRSENCFSCSTRFGGFLLLPLCRRACFSCLVHHEALWMIPLASAKSCFELEDCDILTLPILYPNNFNPVCRDSSAFVNVLQAKEAAVSKFGSEAAVLALGKPCQNTNTLWSPHFSAITLPRSGKQFDQYRKASKHYQKQYQAKETPAQYLCDTAYLGLGTVRLPYLHGTARENGVCCQDCYFEQTRAANAEELPQFRSENSDLAAMYSKRQFLDHLNKYHDK